MVVNKKNFRSFCCLTVVNKSSNEMALSFINKKEIVNADILNKVLSKNQFFKETPITQNELDHLVNMPIQTINIAETISIVGGISRLCKLTNFIGLSEKYRGAGVYIWTNLITNEQYVGSSIDLSFRVQSYFFPRALSATRAINKNIAKYGIEKFRVSIVVVNFFLRSTELSHLKRTILILEQYYIMKLHPSLNMLYVAGGVWSTDITEEQRNIIRKRNSIITYVYLEGVLIAIAESALALCKITGASPSKITEYTSVKGDTKSSRLYGKFTITRESPSPETPVNLITETELRAIFNEARETRVVTSQN